MTERKLRHIAGSLFTAAGVLLIINAVIWIGGNQWTAYKAGTASEAVIEKISRDGGDEERWIVDGREYAGILEIPSLGLTLPVLQDWSMDGLNIAPCRYAGQAETGDLVIAGHNYRRHFTGIRSMEAGSEVIYTEAGGDRHEYRVARSEVIWPENINEMIGNEKSDWDLTLFTCTRGGKARYALRCIANRN